MKAIASHERKLVTVLFADLTNSTGLAERLDPEQLQDVMDAYANAVRGAIEAEGGTVEKFIGDAVMAVFGVPAAHEDDAARALRAALRVQWSLEELNDWLAEVHGLTLQAHMGVHIGAVIAATDPQPGERMVTGVAVNIAQRLEESAEPGQIRVSARAARAAAGFRFDEIGPLVLKGIEEPVVAFELLEEAPEEGAERPLFRSPMVAREHEMALLQSVFDRVASEETPHLVTIYGDPGVGKSRLVLEFCAAAESSADGPRARIVRGRCLPYGEGVTYWPLAEILKRHAGVLDSDPRRLALQKVDVVGHEILTPDLAADPARAIAALCHTVGLQRASPGADEGDPRRMHSEISAAWRSYFSAVARSGPTIVVVEDIHWADPALLDLFDELADHAQGALLFLATARPELSGRRPSWGGGRRNRSNLLLEPLAPADVDLLVEALFGGQHLPGSVRSKIVERAGGNPFFVEEIARHLLEETGLTVGGTGGARAASALAVVESVEIPDTLQGVLAARMDLLGRLEKRTLQTASVVGRVFWVGPVARVLAADPLQIEDALGDLEDRGLVLARLSSSIAGEREYLFKHILTRDVAYESLPRRERATLHAEVAAWIESVAGDRWPEFVEPLAHHYGQAYRSARDQPGADQASTEALRERAFRYALDASDQARGKLALDAAERMAEAALELAIGPEQRSRAFEALGDMYFLSSRGELAWASLREAVDARAPTAVAPDADLARAAAKALQVVTRGRGSMRGRLTAEEAAPYLEIALRHLGPEDSEARARLLTVQSFWPYSFRGASHSDLEREAARRAGEEATAMAKRLDRADLAAAALDGVGAYYLSRGLYGRMDDVVARRLDLVPALTDPLEVGDIYAGAAWASFHIGRYAEAVTLADEGYRRAMPSAPVMGLYCLDFRSVGRCRLGDWDGFFADVRLFGELLDERSDRPPGYASDHIAAAAFVHDVREEGALAERQLRILDWLEGVEERPSQGWAVWRALLLSRRGDHASARELLARSEEGSQWGFGYRLEALCDVIGEQEAWDDAASTVDEAHRHAEEAGLLALPHFAGRLSGLAALAGGDVGVGIDLLTRASAGFAERGAAWEAARTDVRLAEALARNGDDQEASSRARAALAVLEPMRSMREVADARRLLG